MSNGEGGDSKIGEESKELTPAKLLAAAGEFDLESIHILNLQDCGVEDISAISNCTNLTRLDARRNEISILRPLKNLKLLTWLNLSANRITNIDPLSGLECLIDLNAAGNLIGNFDRIKCLQPIKTLQKLRFSDTVEKLSNPICHSLSYEKNILQMFPNLLVLDGLRVRGKGSELFKMCNELDEQIRTGRTFGPVEERALPGAWLQPGYFSLPSNTSDDFATNEFRQVLSECQKLNRSAKEQISSMEKSSK